MPKTFSEFCDRLVRDCVDDAILQQINKLSLVRDSVDDAIALGRGDEFRTWDSDDAKSIIHPA